MPVTKGKKYTVKRTRRKRKVRLHLTPQGKKLFTLGLTVLFAGVFIFSAVKLVGMFFKYRSSRRVYTEVAEEGVEFVVPKTGEEPETVTETETDELTDNQAEEPVFEDVTVAEPAEEEEEISGSLPWAKEERTAAVTGISVKWESLRSKNKDVAAWLYLPDSNINYPVMKKDDNEYYLNHNFYKKEDESGALFFDCRNDLDGSTENIIIYGHRRNDKSMFGSIAKYSKIGYLQEHPVMYLIMPDKAYKVEIFACRTVHALPKFFLTSFNSREEFQSYIDTAISSSYWESPVEVTADSPILTLATCSTYYRDDDPRLLVHGKLTLIQ